MADLHSRITPHIPEYAKQIAGLTNVPCAEGQDTIDIDNDDWVLLRDSYNDEKTLTFNFSHRRCAVAAWGPGHILPKPPAPKRPSDLSYAELEGLIEAIQQTLWWDENEQMWDRDKDWSPGSNTLDDIASTLIEYGLQPDAVS